MHHKPINPSDISKKLIETIIDSCNTDVAHEDNITITIQHNGKTIYQQHYKIDDWFGQTNFHEIQKSPLPKISNPNKSKT